MKTVICGTGSAIPEYRMDNCELSQLVDTNDEWIRERTGIQARHIAKKETTVSLAAGAAKAALENSGISSEEVDLIIVSTISSEVILPCTACEVQRMIGASNAVCFDLNAACSGFVLAYNTAAAGITAGIYKTALVIGSECLSKLTNWKDRGTCILFGDGAGAVVLKGEEGEGRIPFACSDGESGNVLTCKTGLGQISEGEEYMQMDGQEVFKFAVRKVPEAIREVLSRNNIGPEKVDWYILHQANKRIVEAVARHLKEPIEKFPVNMQEYGNTSSASIPVLLDDMNRTGVLKRGQTVVIAGFGAGLTWCASMLEW
ncbi:MAG: beta-ketoacyl-ACP synthase III [Eubacteriales bacterium]|nr:beta-ketoacyl-ACP synthase III [Eubacteriales bacterium]